MKTVFMGTPDFADVSFKALLDGGYEVAAVFTRPDSPKNRGMKLSMPPVKETAIAHGIPVYQPKNFKEEGAFEVLKALSPDVVVVASYGVILPQRVLELPKYGCINVHASLLPKYRGASPINAAIIDGCGETGVTIMKMAKGIDTGDMICSKSLPILPDDTYGALHDKLADMGGELLLHALELIERGEAVYTKQDDSLSCYAHMIEKGDAEIVFSENAEKVSCRIRGYDPAPGAYSYLGEEKIKLFSAVYCDDSTEKAPGQIIGCGKNGLLVQAEGGTVLIKEVQLSGKKRMSAADCFRGRPQLLEKSFKA